MQSRFVRLVLTACVVTAFVTCALARQDAVDPAHPVTIWLFKLDPKTETDFASANRTDKHFFHGLRIVKRHRHMDAEVGSELRSWMTLAERQGVVPLVRDGEYGIRIEISNARPRDAIVCFHCRPPRLRVTGRTMDEEREIELTADQDRGLRVVLDRTLGGH